MHMNGFHYVYILVSETDPTKHYTGYTTDLLTRLEAHNQGRSPHTAKYVPWRIETAVAFRDEERARAFAYSGGSGSGNPGESDHGFRAKVITDSGGKRSSIPAQSDHRFRWNPIGDSGQSDHGRDEVDAG
ncbi:MAG: hypothetical protein AMXMBFR4_34730 [Candidatus Hydrogenedentota bacterium]